MASNATATPIEQIPNIGRSLAAELRSMAGWLSLESFAIARKGNLARPLIQALPREVVQRVRE